MSSKFQEIDSIFAETKKSPHRHEDLDYTNFTQLVF